MRKPVALTVVAAFAAPVVVGCLTAEGPTNVGEGEGEADVDDDSNDDISDDQTIGDRDILIGAFQIRLNGPTAETPGFTSVVGKVFDGPTPAGIVFEPTATAGACVLSEPRVPFCEVSCGAAVCVEDDVCQAFPTSQSLGAVEVEGLGDTFALSAVANTYQPPVSTTLPYPPFSNGGEVTVTAHGSPFTRPFRITATGIDPLELTSSELSLVRDEDFVLTWSAGDDGAQIGVKLDISHHGGTRGVINCTADDTGALTIDASLVTALLDLGVAGFPTVIVSRVSTGESVLAAGRVDLNVTSTVEAELAIDGLVSCTADDECPAGQRCGTDLACVSW